MTYGEARARLSRALAGVAAEKAMKTLVAEVFDLP
jgi:hypothetical protein